MAESKRTPTYPLGLPPELRAAFQKAADEEGQSLAEWIRESCQMRLAGRIHMAVDVARPDAVVEVLRLGAVTVVSGKRPGHGVPDPKPSQRHPAAEDKPKRRGR